MRSSIMDINRYRSVVGAIESISDAQKNSAQDIKKYIIKNCEKAKERARKAHEGSETIRSAAQSTLIFKDELRDIDDIVKDRKSLDHAMGGSSNFIHVYANISHGLKSAWQSLEDICIGLEVPELHIPDKEDEGGTARERMQDLSAEFSLNADACASFLTACNSLSEFHHILIDMSQQIGGVMDTYFNTLTDRHSNKGIKIAWSPVLTDFAMSIYNNIANHGERTEVSNEEEISAYSLRKAQSIISFIKDDEMGEIIRSEMLGFSTLLRRELKSIWDQAYKLQGIFEEECRKMASIQWRRFQLPSRAPLDDKLYMIGDLDPNQVKYRDRSANMTEEERHDLAFKNEVIARIVGMLQNSERSPSEIAEYVWERCKELNKHYLEVNSFYTCRIAQGSQFSGKSNGQLEVIPGKRPTSRFEDIIGSGFDDVRNFAEHIRRTRKWAPLYSITSPRKSAAKDNVLLIGPQGCGKTEVLRAVANEEDSIAIFAQGSDFLTAWMGEAQKNPKRLFEAAVKLQKDSDKHVHILIDEIDSVLNNDRSTTTINLSLEFQMIMDGVIEYPNISVWGTTNNPQRIPMPMIRRFAKTLIVGELDQEQRVALFKHFFSVLPLSKEFTDRRWDEMARRMKGATGDVIRKVADMVWRSEISRFIEEEPDDADRMLRIIRQLSHDPAMGANIDSLGTKRADEDICQKNLGGSRTTRRKKFLKSFSKVFEVSPDVVDDAISSALDNVGIINKIETAVQTYADAEKFLAEVKSSRSKKSETANV